MSPQNPRSGESRHALGKLKLSAVILFAFYLGFLSSHSSAFAGGQQQQKRVLILYSFENEVGLYSDFDESLRAKLKSGEARPIQFYTEFLDLARFPSREHEKKLLDVVRVKYSKANISLIFPVSLPAINFIRTHGEDLFPGVPTVFCAVDGRWIVHLPLPSNTTGIVETTKINKTLAAALQLQPDTRRVVVVGGTLPYEREWMKEIQSDLREYEGKLDFTYFTDLAMDELLRRIANLPQHTIVLYMMMWRDGAGENFLPKEVLLHLAQASSVPIYGVFENFLGTGIVGGDLIPLKTAGTMAAFMGLHVLNGEKTAEIPVLSEDNASYVFDWRQLRRWHISEDRLPPGSIVLFKEPSAWELYKWQFTIAILVIIVQTGLITLLLVQQRLRKRAEISLATSEKRYQNLVESSHDWIWEVDSEAVYTYASPQCYEILGYDPKELIGKTPFDLMPPEEAERVGLAFGHIAAQRQAFRAMESTNLHKDGRLVVLETNGVPIFDEQSQFCGYCGMDRDITKRKQAEDALRKAEADYRNIFEEALEGIYRTSPEGKLLAANPALARILGYSSAEEVMAAVTDAGHQVWVDPEERRAWVKLLEEQGIVRGYECQQMRRDGKRIWVSLSSRRVCGPDGKTLYYDGFIEDITARKRAETELCDNAALTARVLEATSGGVWDWNIPSGKAVFSRRYVAMLGYEPGEFPEDYDAWSRLVHPDDVHRVKQAHADHIVRHKDFSVDLRMREKSGNWHWVHSRGVLIERDEGKPVRMVGTHTDIQERKRAEEALRRKTAFDAIATEVLNRFATCPPLEVDAAVLKSLEAIAEFIGADHAYIVRFSADRTTRSCTYEWCGSGVKPRIHEFQHVPIGTVPGLESRLLAGEVVRISSPDDYPPDSAERHQREREGHLAALNVPIWSKGEIPGSIGLHSHARPIVWSDDDVARLRTVGEAVANALERKESQEGLRRSEEKFSTAFHASPVAMTIFSRTTGRFIEVNKAFEENTGFRAQEIIGHTPQELGIYANPVDKETISQALTECKSIRNSEIQIRAKGRDVRTGLLSIQLIEFSGEPCSLLVLEDITDRKRIEEASREIGSRMLMVQEEERRRVARELHDDFSQRLALLAIDLEQLGQQPRATKQEWGPRIRSMWAQTQELTSDVHRLSYQLHPSKLEDLGLVLALQSYCHSLAQQAGIDVKFSHANIPQFLSKEISLCIYRVVQEALRNVVKHSGAKTAAVVLSRAPNEVHLTISDSGKGFASDGVRSGKGLGLVSMQERVRYVGGVWSIDARPSGGTRVVVRIPVPSQQATADLAASSDAAS